MFFNHVRKQHPNCCCSSSRTRSIISRRISCSSISIGSISSISSSRTGSSSRNGSSSQSVVGGMKYVVRIMTVVIFV